MKEEILDFIHEIEEDGLSDDEANLLNIIEFVITENEFDDDMLGDIYDGLENYLGDEDEELQGDFEEEMEEEEEEIEESEEGDISNQLIEKIVTRIRGGKKIKTKLGYRGGKKIKPSTLKKMKRAAKKRSRKKVKASTIRKRMKSLKRTRRKFKSFLKNKRKK